MKAASCGSVSFSEPIPSPSVLTTPAAGSLQSHSCPPEGMPRQVPSSLLLALALCPFPDSCSSSPPLCSQESPSWWRKLRAGRLLPGTNSFPGWERGEWAHTGFTARAGGAGKGGQRHCRVNSLPCSGAAGTRHISRGNDVLSLQLESCELEKNLTPIEAKGCSWMKEAMSGSQNTSRTKGL